MVDKDFLPLLKISDSPVLMKFLHECVDDLVGKREANFDNYNSVDIEWTKEDYDKARKGIQNCFSQSVIEDELNLRKQNLDVNVEEAVRNCFLIRRNEIFQAMAKEAVLKNGNNLVENIDWKLKWVLGSSDLASIREPLLQCNGRILEFYKTDENG
ncbi:hypothetical protein JTB14_023508 [Gonioctena quinquepunctata]|nr:hypothetical protein JTB14_023508 [Gonioctena quinquepunctata]